MEQERNWCSEYKQRGITCILITKADKIRYCHGKYMLKLGGFDLMDLFGVKIKNWAFNTMLRFDFIKL